MMTSSITFSTNDVPTVSEVEFCTIQTRSAPPPSIWLAFAHTCACAFATPKRVVEKKTARKLRALVKRERYPQIANVWCMLWGGRGGGELIAVLCTVPTVLSRHIAIARGRGSCRRNSLFFFRLSRRKFRRRCDARPSQ